MQYIYHCLICRASGRTHAGFKAPAIEGMLINEKQDPRVMRMFENLAKHVQIEHPAEFQANILKGMMMAGFLNYKSFEIPDPKVFAMRDWMRAKLASVTRRFSVSDDQLSLWLHRLSLPDEIFRVIFLFAQNLRNIEEELADFAAKDPGAADPPGPNLQPSAADSPESGIILTK